MEYVLHYKNEYFVYTLHTHTHNLQFTIYNYTLAKWNSLA